MSWRILTQFSSCWNIRNALLWNAWSWPWMKHVILNVDWHFSVFPGTQFQVQIFIFSKYHKPHSNSVVDVGEGFFPRDKLIMYILFCCMPFRSFPSLDGALCQVKSKLVVGSRSIYTKSCLRRKSYFFFCLQSSMPISWRI